MKKADLHIILVVLFTLCACNRNSNQEEDKKNAPALTYLDYKVASWFENGYYDGLAMLVVKDEQRLFESYHGGYTDTTTLHVASAGKWIAAATIAAVVDEGKLSWDDKVNKYLPEFKDIKGEATLRQLLSHTAGYPDYQPKGNRRDDYQTLEEAVSNIVNLPADTLPDTKFRYGGLSMQVAGRMAELATGKDWETLFQEKLGQPLGMKYSYFVPVSEEGGFNPMLGGGFKTCLRDYMNFLNMFIHNGQYNGRQVLSDNVVREIESDQVKHAKVNQPEYVVNARQNYHNGIYGLGIWREEEDENGKITLLSSPGWAGAYPWIDRKNNIYGFVLAKVNVRKAYENGFSSFCGSPVVPLIIRDALKQQNYPSDLKIGRADIGNNIQLYYEEMGEGEAVIFVHGHSLNHSMWDEQFFEFSKGYRAIRYDIRGYGYSSPQDEINQFTHVEDLTKLMDVLNIEKAHIVGLSLGGYIGTDMLGWYPERVLSCVLASGNVRENPKPSIPMDKQESERRDKEIAELKRKGIDPMKREWFNKMMHSGGSKKERMRHLLWNMVYQWDAWQPLHKEVRLIAGGDAYDELKKNKPHIPVMILEGKSENNHFSEQPAILDYLPKGKLIILNDCGHMLNMEQPELLNQTIMNFYDSINEQSSNLKKCSFKGVFN